MPWPTSSSRVTRSNLPQIMAGVRRRFADAGWSVIQTPVAAGLAWYIAHTLLGHHEPFFAPTAAAVSLSKTRVLRGQRALQLITGVVLGIGVGSVFRAALGGHSAIAIAIAALVALALALALGGGFLEQGVLFVNQAATSAILMIAVTGAATASERLTDALIGGGVTLALTVILFPAAPLRLIEDAVRRVLAALRDTLARLAELAAAGTPADPAWTLTAGQQVQHQLGLLQEALSAARQVAWLSPRRWPDRERVRRAQERAGPVPLLAATVLSLAHASTASQGTHRQHQALAELAAACAALARGDAPAAAAHAAKVQALVAGSQAELIGQLLATGAADLLRLAASASPGS
jgi:uncharacterized membrane protein YgaE (UPF0421/DUF939 family)